MTGGYSLSPRQIRTALDLLTAGVVISIAWALAGLTWRIAGHAGTGAITVPSGRSGPAVRQDISPALALAPFGKASVSEATQPTSLPLELKGVFAAQPATLSTAFISVEGAEAAPFRIGDTVNGATIQGILRDRVVLSNGGQIEHLAFPDSSLTPEQRAAAQQQQAAAPSAAPAAPAAAAAAAAPPLSAQNAGSLLQRLDASPVEGGLRIGENGPPGLRQGDVLQAVNGTPLSDPTAAAAALQAAQANGSAQITLVRDGQRVLLTVPLR